MKILLRLTPFVFLQLLCVGANLSTLERYNALLGGGPNDLALLWAGYMVPRAVLTPVWAALSDRFGRRPIILIGGIGQVLASGLYATGGTWSILMASRLLDSVTSAHGAVAQGTVGDVTTPEKRAGGLGLLGAVISLAFIAGPVLGAVVAAKLGYNVLGLCFVVLQGASLLYYALSIPETAPRNRARGAGGVMGMMRGAWRMTGPGSPGLALLGIALLASAGTFAYYSAMPLGGHAWLGWEELEAGKAFALLGLLGAVVQGGVVRALAPRLGERALASAGLVLAATGLAVGAGGTEAGLWVATALVAVGGGLSAPTIGAMVSRRAGEARQGAAMGLYQSMTTLGRGVGPAAAALAVNLGPASAFVLGAALCLAGAVGTLFAAKQA